MDEVLTISVTIFLHAVHHFVHRLVIYYSLQVGYYMDIQLLFFIPHGVQSHLNHSKITCTTFGLRFAVW